MFNHRQKQMNNIREFKNNVEDIIEDLYVITTALENGSFINQEDTVSYVLDLYKDTPDRLKDAFSSLRENIGEQKLSNLKDYGKENDDS